MEQHQSQFSMARMCHVFSVSRSGYYAWNKRDMSGLKQENEKLVAKIREIHQGPKRSYGSPRIHTELNHHGLRCSKNRVVRLMKEHGIRAKTRKAYRITTNSKHHYRIAPNLLKRSFTVEKANQTWVGDITYIPTIEGWLYLAVVIDLFSRKVVGWSMDSNMTQDLVIDAMENAIQMRKPNEELIFHSDRGSQYAASRYQKLLENHKVRPSMSRKADCWDNAVAESFFSSLKSELVDWERYQNREEAKQSIFHYIEAFYNRERLHSFLGNQSPEAFESAA